jgi:hypothetical protein
MTAVSNMPDMTRKKMAVRARHRLCLRETFSLQKNAFYAGRTRYLYSLLSVNQRVAPGDPLGVTPFKNFSARSVPAEVQG